MNQEFSQVLIVSASREFIVSAITTGSTSMPIRVIDGLPKEAKLISVEMGADTVKFAFIVPLSEQVKHPPSPKTKNVVLRSYATVDEMRSDEGFLE